MLERKVIEELITSYKLRLSKMGYTEEKANVLSEILLEMYIWQIDNKVKHELEFPDKCQFGWYVSSRSCTAYYLHTNGKMYYGADESEDSTTGFFKTYQEALDAKSKYEYK